MSNPVCRLCLNVWPLLSSDVSGVSVCPPVALDSGVELLCRLFELWGQVPTGVLALTEWLLGDEEACDEAVSDEASSLVRKQTHNYKRKQREIFDCRLHVDDEVKLMIDDHDDYHRLVFYHYNRDCSLTSDVEQI